MQTSSKPQLKQGVTLLPLCVAHAANMYRWMCDPDVSLNVGLRSDPSLEKSVAWIERALQDPSIRPFAVSVNEHHVGNVVLDRIDDYLGTARLSIYIGDDMRGAGIGFAAAYQCLRKGFQEMGLHKIWLTVHSRNFAAINTYTRLGFCLEGILRDEFFIGEQRLSVLYMGMLKDDFERLTLIVEVED